jgi:hypothetical protein
MEQGPLQSQIRHLADAAIDIGGWLIIEFVNGDLHLVEPETVTLRGHSLSACGVDDTDVEIPYSRIQAVTVELP